MQYERCAEEEAGVYAPRSRTPTERVSFARRETCSTAEGRRGQLLRRVALGLAAIAMAGLCASLFRDSRQPLGPASDLQLAARSAGLSGAGQAKSEVARAIRAGYLRAGFSASRADALSESPTRPSDRTHAHPVPTKLALDRRPLEGEVSSKQPRQKHPHQHPNSTRTMALYRSKRGSFDPRTGPNNSADQIQTSM